MTIPADANHVRLAFGNLFETLLHMQETIPTSFDNANNLLETTDYSVFKTTATPTENSCLELLLST